MKAAAAAAVVLFIPLIEAGKPVRVSLDGKQRAELTLPGSGELDAFAPSPDFKLVAFHRQDAKSITVFDAAAGREKAHLDLVREHPGRLLFSPDNKRLLAVDTRIVGTEDLPSTHGNGSQDLLWLDLPGKSTGALNISWQYTLLTREPVRYQFVYQSRLGQFMGWGLDSGSLLFRDPLAESRILQQPLGRSEGKPLFQLGGTTEWVGSDRGVILLRDGDVLTVQVSTAGAARRLPVPDSEVLGLAVSPEPYLVALLRRGTIYVIDLAPKLPAVIGTIPVKSPGRLRWAGRKTLLFEDGEAVKAASLPKLKARVLSPEARLFLP